MLLFVPFDRDKKLRKVSCMLPLSYSQLSHTHFKVRVKDSVKGNPKLCIAVGGNRSEIEIQ
jgi:hypothetical protein